MFMTPGNWLASNVIEHAPLLAASIGISAEERTLLAPLILTILSWTIAALLLRRLLYSLRGSLLVQDRIGDSDTKYVSTLKFREKCQSMTPPITPRLLLSGP